MFILSLTHLEAKACMVPVEDAETLQQRRGAAQDDFVVRREERKRERENRR